MEVKDVLRNRRKELGLTMKDVADRVGVNEGTVSRWESGKIADMKRDKILLLAKALDISPAVIMEWEQEERPEYYTNPETAVLAQELLDNPGQRILLSASRGLTPENLQLLAQMAEAMKATNRDE